MIRINQLKLQIPHTEEALEKKIQKTLHLFYLSDSPSVIRRTQKTGVVLCVYG
jgi:hypothetical protein